MALWQLRRVPRRITQELRASDCQQDHRGAPSMETRNTNTHLRDCPTLVSPVFLSSPVLLSPALPFSFSPTLFPSLLPASLFFNFLFISLSISPSATSPSSSEGRGHGQVTYAPFLGLLCGAFCILVHGQGSASSRRRDNSLSLCSLYSLFSQESTECFNVFSTLMFFSFCHSHIIKLLSHSISHFWQCKVSACLAETEVFPHCSSFFFVRSWANKLR